MRLIRLLAVAALVTAAAEAQWPPTIVSAVGNANDHALASLGANGINHNVYLAWAERVGDDLSRVMFCRSDDAGASWSTPQQLAIEPGDPRPALLWFGALHVAWAGRDGLVDAQSGDDGASFTITTVPGTAGTTMANIQMVVWGGICAVVRDRRDGQLLAVTQMLGSWHSAVLGHTDAEAPRLECLPSAYGAAVVTTWTDQGRVMAATCEIAGSNPGTHWNVVQLSPQGRFPRAAVTLTSSLASATWLQSGLGIRYATRLGGGTWTAPVTMVAERTQDPSSEGCDPNQPFAFVSSNLNYPVFVWAWSCTHGSQRALFALSRDTGGRTNSRIRLNPGLGARDSSDLLPTLVFDDNTQHAVWLDRPSPSQARSVYHSHSVDHGLTWSLPKPLPTGSHDVDEPPVLTAMNKNVDVAWIGSSHGSVLLQAETVQGHHLYGHGTADRRGIVPPVWVDNLVVPGNAFTVESSSSSRGPIYLLLSPGSGDTAIGSCGHLLVDLPTTRIWSPSEYSSGNAGFFFSVSSTTLLGTEYFCQAVIYDDNGCGFALTRGLAMRVTLP